ncbi:hypothetical protein S40285_08458 [Stachybotrys chlorohalonatus IBT 40285]|uniref:Zn(2)-C6 fungal-type domain-containing protein n=1 Tax=Stachybotrys chlorohalonatus (strain IBT 40285) TaxID=1283841 RepID=A0A084QYJ4_STAC4|nr:hypothetical protein S40285_08458 [Stachybotrys chlorohalonata IBT 40285]
MKKRLRACEECHRLKIKCDVSASTGGACERCNRNSLECVPAAPRLQRDRVSELEARVQELSNALQEQRSSATPSWSTGTLLENHNDAILSFLDARILPSKQQELLYLYANQAGAVWPVVRMPMELDTIRSTSPVLLLSVLAYAFTQEAQGVDIDVHDELVRETMRVLGDEVIAKGSRSLELVQALLVATFWSKETRKGKYGSCYQLAQLASDMAIDLGIAGFALQPSPVAYFCRYENPTFLEARRTWLACFLALSTWSISVRRPNTVSWDAHHQECLLHLESQGDSSDLLFCQIVRITKLIEDISNTLCLCHLATFVDGNDYSSHFTIESLKDKVDAWAAQVPHYLASSQTLKVWHHVAMIHLHEIALHTPTNKASFAAPFIPGRIPIQDFPRPANIIPPLKTALEAIVHHCQAVIETIADIDPVLALGLPPFSFAPTALYSLYVLVTTMVVSTTPENTYGQYLTNLPMGSFRIEHCGLRLRTLTSRMTALDPTMSCYTTRLFDATSWLEEWYINYMSILERFEMNLVT